MVLKEDNKGKLQLANLKIDSELKPRTKLTKAFSGMNIKRHHPKDNPKIISNKVKNNNKSTIHSTILDPELVFRSIPFNLPMYSILPCSFLTHKCNDRTFYDRHIT